MFNSMIMGAFKDPVLVDTMFKINSYTGTGSNITVNNGLNLSSGGGVWIKRRDDSPNFPNGKQFFLCSTARPSIWQRPAQTYESAVHSDFGFNSTGFQIGPGSDTGSTINEAGGSLFIAYSFKKTARFFDTLIYSGNGTTKQLTHNLGIAPGWLMILEYTNNQYTAGYHRSGGYYNLHQSGAATFSNPYNFGDNTNFIAPDDTKIYLGSADAVNRNGASYICYMLAHDPDGDGVVKCASYTGNGSTSGPTINLGWEPQFIMIKTNGSGITNVWDNVRGISGATDPRLNFTGGAPEVNDLNYITPSSTGFQITSTSSYVNNNGEQYNYVAIKKGP